MTNPLVSEEVDLRDFPFMPLDVIRLRDSDLAALASAEEFRCAILLWCASWHQLPAASLPDDDAVLANLSGLGREVRKWRKLKSVALRGFVKCDDGRFYHPVVAEKAIEAWEKRRKASGKGKAGASARWSNSHSLGNGTGISTGNARANANVIAQAMPAPMPVDGNRQGEGQGQESSASLESQPRSARAVLDCKKSIVSAFEKANSPTIPNTSRVDVWAAQGHDLAICAAVVGEGIARKPSISTLAYFDNAIADAHRKRGSNGMNGHAKPEEPETDAEREERQHRLVSIWKRTGKWHGTGPDPDSSGCQVPKELIAKWTQPS